MKQQKNKLFTHITNVITIALIIECFLCAMMLVKKYGRENCFERIEEITHQAADMFTHSIQHSQDHLEVFSGILASNHSNPDELLQSYMKNFCRTQDFDAVCIHHEDGSIVSYGEHPHEEVALPSFEEEVSRLPYVSSIFITGDAPEDRYLYLAVPVVRGGRTVAVLYGYLTLADFPNFITSTAYDGKGQFYIVDGDTGDFLMDEYHGILGNIYDGSMGERKTREGYDIDTMRSNIRTGKSGYYVFTSQRTGLWYYTYYTPMTINNWSMQMTIDEPTAFAGFNEVNWMLMILAAGVIVLMVIHILVLMQDERQDKKKARHTLHKSNYINSVQRALITAHNNPDFVGQALSLVAAEIEAETVLLLGLTGNTISTAQYFPSKDKAQAMAMMGRNVRDEFPMLYDQIVLGNSIIFDGSNSAMSLSESALELFAYMDINNLLLVPILDSAGSMKGILSAVNVPPEKRSCEMMECVTYDFFIALSNLEKLAIVQRMGTMDYLTNTKNRNCFESDISSYAHWECQSLWCVFIDVNGLHDVNNTQGHKAGDKMLCTVAEAVKRVFGEENTYRMGGDEFVSFVANGTHQTFMARKYLISEELAKQGYYVSVGFAGIEKGPEGIFDVRKVIEEAEDIMYRDKWDYYQRSGIPTDRGHFPSLKDQSKA